MLTNIGSKKTSEYALHQVDEVVVNQMRIPLQRLEKKAAPH